MEPVVGCGEGCGVDAADLAAALHASTDEARALEDLDVLGGRGKGHAEGRGEFADVVFAGGEGAEHGAAGWIGQGAKDGVERLGGLLNHVVEDRRAEGDCQLIG